MDGRNKGRAAEFSPEQRVFLRKAGECECCSYVDKHTFVTGFNALSVSATLQGAVVGRSGTLDWAPSILGPCGAQPLGQSTSLGVLLGCHVRGTQVIRLRSSSTSTSMSAAALAQHGARHAWAPPAACAFVDGWADGAVYAVRNGLRLLRVVSWSCSERTVFGWSGHAPNADPGPSAPSEPSWTSEPGAPGCRHHRRRDADMCTMTPASTFGAAAASEH